MKRLQIYMRKWLIILQGTAACNSCTIEGLYYYIIVITVETLLPMAKIIFYFRPQRSQNNRSSVRWSAVPSMTMQDFLDYLVSVVAEINFLQIFMVLKMYSIFRFFYNSLTNISVFTRK